MDGKNRRRRRRKAELAREGRKRLAGKCLFCPEDAYVAMDAHRPAAGKEYKWENILPLCANCHRKVHGGLIVILGRYTTTLGEPVIHYRDADGQEVWLKEPFLFGEVLGEHQQQGDDEGKEGGPVPPTDCPGCSHEEHRQPGES